MKLLTSILIILMLAITAFSCDDGDTTFDYSFDVRSCNGDIFAEAVPEEADQEGREQQMKVWLAEEGIEVTSVELKLDFLVGVCYACVVCPTGDRYFINTSAEVSGKQVGILNFLNWVEE